VFDGRLSENFKLSSGTFVTVGALRVAAVSAIGGAASDAIVCGENRSSVGLLIFLNEPFCRTLAPTGDLAGQPAVVEAIRSGLERFNARAGGAGGRIARALILGDSPDAHSGEITDKGYINQTLARARRATDIERLFTEPVGTGVLTF